MQPECACLSTTNFYFTLKNSWVFQSLSFQWSVDLVCCMQNNIVLVVKIAFAREKPQVRVLKAVSCVALVTSH